MTGGRAILVPAVLALSLVACGRSDRVRVAAASSLVDVVERLDVGDLEVNLGGSATLATQLLEGVPADVFVSADEVTMARVVDAGRSVGPVRRVATNDLVLVARDGVDVAGLDDLVRRDLVVGLCIETVPCGRLAAWALAACGLAPAVDTEEPDVRTLVGKVASGEVDIALVYRTDAVATGVRVVADPRLRATTAYVAVAIAGGDAERSERFLDRLGSDEGRAAFRALGFGPAETPAAVSCA